MENSNNKTKISTAIDGNNNINIKYHAGSQPGSTRLLFPIKIVGDSLFARYVNSNIRKVKQFKIEYIEFVSFDEGESYDFELAEKDKSLKISEYKNFKDVVNAHSDEISAMGFHIESTENSISICSYLKNGKPRKTPEIYITYSEFHDVTLWHLGDKTAECTVTRELATRPYTIRAKGKTTRAFKNLDKAIDHFLVCVIDQFTLNCDSEKK